MHFEYNPSSPNAFEGWLYKANIGFLERWQKRYFRLQGRCIYYFKKEIGPDPPNGKIPIVDIDVSDLPNNKKRNFILRIQLLNPKLAKRGEYLISADTEEQKNLWKKAIMEQCSFSIVGEPFISACHVSPIENHVQFLVPYFLPPVFQILDTTGFKLRGVWTVEVPTEFIDNGLAILNQNYQLQTDDIHNALAVLLAYLKMLPVSLLSGEAMPKFASKVHPDDIRQLVLEASAPVRQFLRMLGLHFKKVLEAQPQNGVTHYSLLPFLGPLLIRPVVGSTMAPAQVRSIQDQVAQTFINQAPRILEDVHQFNEATRKPVIYRARVLSQSSQKVDEILNASRGLLINIVREDDSGWCTVFTSNQTVGLIHKDNIKRLSQEEENEMKSGQNIAGLLDVVREQSPEMLLLFDSMNNEISLLREALDTVK